MQVPVRLSQESLFGFLTSTRLPVVSSVAVVVRWISLGLAVVGLAYAGYCFANYADPWWSAELPWSGAVPALTSAPVFASAWWFWRRNRLQLAATWMFVALFTLSILANWPRGAFSPAWYLHPFLCLLATISLGVVPGLGLTLVAVTAMLLAGLGHGLPADANTNLWVHVTSLSGLTLASALAGAITNRLVFMALTIAESQRRKNFESSRALRYREKLLRHAMRVETVGDLAGMICHQLRNAHQVLIGHVALAEAADDDERKRRLQLIEETLKATQPLLDQLMLMAHPNEGKTTSCDMGAAVRQFYEQARIVLPTGIDLSCSIAEEPMFALLDPQGLTHALWNLAINARQAMGAAGSIELSCHSTRHQVWIEVTDSGPGIAAETRERIFDPYFTTKPPGQGTGLGLAAVARFMRSSNGAIQVDTAIDQGTTFRLRFPRAVGAQPDSTTVPTPGRSGVA
ncbi:MAG: HAMP domain-containing histidine kinase [Planctomycetes bacterium]|nr:HAMP domain-containing histidine kinase [Planctomycetota bacterium]